MKLSFYLAFFGLIAQMAAGQVLEVKSPTISNLNCVITSTPSPGSTDLNIYIFGDGGEAYVSRDKAESWQRLDVDPIQRRNIKVAVRVNDTLMLLAGGEDSDLLKLSTDDGETFQDFQLLNFPDKTLNIGWFIGKSDSNPEAPREFLQVTIVQQETKERNVISWWPGLLQPEETNFWDGNITTGYILAQSPESSFSRFLVKEPETYYTNSYKILSLGYNPAREGFMITTLSRSVYKIKITTVDSYDGVGLIALNHNNCLDPNYRDPNYYNWEAHLDNFEDTSFEDTYRNFPELGANVSIKSSAISHANKLFWHVGGDEYGQNGFIVRDGVVTKFPDFSLNQIKDCSYNGIDAVIAVGNYGRIYSNRTDLALATPVLTIGKTDKISAYPNPFNSEITIMSEADNYVSLINISGIVLKQIQLLPGSNSVSLTELDSGIYFLKNKQQVLKLIKQ